LEARSVKAPHSSAMILVWPVATICAQSHDLSTLRPDLPPLLRFDGGYVNDRQDPGGPTNQSV